MSVITHQVTQPAKGKEAVKTVRDREKAVGSMKRMSWWRPRGGHLESQFGAGK